LDVSENKYSVDELIEEIREILRKEFKEWWSYEEMKRVGGYRGITFLMMGYKYGPFDKYSQWIKISNIPKASFYNYKKIYIKKGLIFPEEKKLTRLGKCVCKAIESFGPIISEKKLDEIIDQCRDILKLN